MSGNGSIIIVLFYFLYLFHYLFFLQAIKLLHLDLIFVYNTETESNLFNEQLIKIEEIIKKEIPLFLSDDAHRIEDTGALFEEAEINLTSLGYKKRFISL